MYTGKVHITYNCVADLLDTAGCVEVDK